MVMFAGMDVHSKTTVFELQGPEGRKVSTGRVATTREGLASLVQHGFEPGTRCALEATSQAFIVARWLMELGFDPVVVAPDEVRAKASRPNQKSDRRDAHEMCEGIRSGIYRKIVYVPPPEVHRLRRLVTMRRHLVGVATCQVNMARKHPRDAALQVKNFALVDGKHWDRLLGDIEDHREVRAMMGLNYDVWKSTKAQIERVDQMLDEALMPFDEEVKLLQTVPGVGRVVSATVIAVLGDVRRFRSAKKVASYGGLVPSSYQSSDRTRQGHITKRGSKEMRAMLVEAAQHACRPSSPLYPHFGKILVKGGHKVAAVAMAHRLLRILFAMLRDRKPFDPEKAGVERGPFRKVVNREYRLSRG